MNIHKVSDAAGFFDAPGALHMIGRVNWPGEFPARPDVRFAVAHTGGAILLKYFVSEEYTLAAVTEDNGPVWTDSCVEFFIAFDGAGYYNLETTCIGRALLGFRKQREVFTHADRATLDTILRRPSLGTEPFAEKRGLSWSLEIEIPVTAFFRHRIDDISAQRTSKQE